MIAAQDSVKVAQNANNFEKFTNADYRDLEELDFRSFRYKKRERKFESKSELDSELQENDGDNENEDEKDEVMEEKIVLEMRQKELSGSVSEQEN